MWIGVCVRITSKIYKLNRPTDSLYWRKNTTHVKLIEVIGTFSIGPIHITRSNHSWYFVYFIYFAVSRNLIIKTHNSIQENNINTVPEHNRIHPRILPWDITIIKCYMYRPTYLMLILCSLWIFILSFWSSMHPSFIMTTLRLSLVSDRPSEWQVIGNSTYSELGYVGDKETSSMNTWLETSWLFLRATA